MPRRLGFVMHPRKTAVVHDFCNTDHEKALIFLNYYYYSVVEIHLDT